MQLRRLPIVLILATTALAACSASPTPTASGAASGSKSAAAPTEVRAAPTESTPAATAAKIPAPPDNTAFVDPADGAAVASINGHVIQGFKTTTCMYGRKSQTIAVRAEAPDHYEIDFAAYASGELLLFHVGQQGPDLGDRAWYVGRGDGVPLTAKLDGKLVRVTGSSTGSAGDVPTWATARPIRVEVAVACPGADLNKWPALPPPND
ncbi:hypothetical protein [Janibacter sp. HTCC2649]|uniref:hypothetical protein n=1 Tax=Janibacter sp. HTCC2649 TaxID=313589 RepID=UPI0003238403|nr:hypothetical protein [Janibacter sp. HTCC2649]